MPLWLIKYLPYGILAVLIVGGLWYVDHGGYKRAENEATARDNARKADLLKVEALLIEQTRLIEGSMQSSINQSDAMIVRQLSNLDLTNKTIIQPTLTKEIRREVRLSDPAAGITDIMRQELNRARGFSQQYPCPADSNAVACFSLPESAALSR